MDLEMSTRENQDQKVESVPASLLPTNVHETFVEDESEKKKSSEQVVKPTLYQRYRLYIHIAAVLLYTGYIIAAWILHGRQSLVASLLWAFVCLKIMFYHVPTTILTTPLGWFFTFWIDFAMKFSLRVRWIVSLVFTVALIVGVTLGLPVDESKGTLAQRGRSLGGLCVFIIVLYVTSKDRKKIRWATVIVGVLMQYLLGLFILKTSVGYDIFNWLSHLCTTLLDFSNTGMAFIVGDKVANSGSFATAVLPAVLFFASIVKIVYFLGGMQWIVSKIAWFMVRVMSTSGAESTVAAASPFVGQGESSLLVLPFLETMTKSEIHSTMTSGFATISGSVLVGFISMGADPQTLITSCVMSTPCGLAISKMRIPETGEPVTKGKVHIPQTEEKESNFLHAAANGAAQGIHLALLIAATVLAFMSLLALVNAFLTWFGRFINIEQLTLQLIMGYIYVPFIWFVGIPQENVLTVSRLMATKTFVNEFVAFGELTTPAIADVLLPRSKHLAVYCLCGFANFGSIGIQIGALGSMAPSRRQDLAELAFSAMLCGTMSTLMSATIAGMLM
ncbi:hypothetical protein K493DRAFT_311337 [Basidiobolus meristosporus CBS 931.73]|uniref:Uncharacterized protein n=1 Tax=Basidiobolus meristosporus CBS 931.73 TaxID=1314790 RepID=A0A1Y1Z2X8_9FUNG|nr:hypothetical protein K493DRAFT_311337 [Basidiobolus meristosporus CBS 931.73]|eukprot:ORY04641.1 hypothetical protein K493DRAFT_311337 [Basidiobolus meristosporus CBS 931.73]